MADATVPSVVATLVGITDVGRVREHNEDSFLVMNCADGRRAASSERMEVALDRAVLMVVCDGMGGAAAGEVASRLAAERMAAELGKADFGSSTPDQIAALMDHAVQLANAEIHKAATSDSAKKGMGTTLTAAVATPGRLFISQVGDSRAYLLRKGHLNQLTKDQSLIGQLIEEGTLTEEEAEKLGGRNIVLQAVGVEDSLRVDTKYWPLLRGDLLLLCSDGLSGMVKDSRLKEILVEHGDDVVAAATKLVAEANESGGRDNITAIVARFEGDGLRAPMEAAGEEIEKAGVAFKAPPPPEVPNPMRKVGWLGLVVLALIGGLFLVLRPTKADLQIEALPREVAVSIVIKGPGGEYRAVSRDGAARIEGVQPSDEPYELVASAEGYFDDRRTLTIAERGQVPLSVWPEPKPGPVEVVAKDAHVWVQIDARGSHRNSKAVAEKFELPVAGEKRRFGNVPAGTVRVEATRPGFGPWSKEYVLAPGGALDVKVPALEEVKGTTVVECAEAGARVEVIDEYGELLDQAEVGDGRARLTARVGRHTLRVRKTGFEDHERPVEFARGADRRLSVTLVERLNQVRLVGPDGSEATVERARSDGGWEPVDVVAPTPSGSKPLRLKAGNYRVRWEAAGSAKPDVEFTVRAGDPPRDIELR